MGKVTKVTVTINTTTDAFDNGKFMDELENVLERVKAIDGYALFDSDDHVVGIVDIETE